MDLIRKIFVSLILLLSNQSSILHANEFYSEYWQQFFWNMWEKDDLSIATYVKIETGDKFKDIRYMQFNEQFAWSASKKLSFEIHYAYLHDRQIIPNSSWRWQHRLELEANRTFLLSPRYIIQTRNRLEIRRVKNEPKTLYRLRQRTMLVIPFENEGILKSFSVFNELFYNVSTHLFTQDRICPFQLTYAISSKVDLDVFVMMRFFHTDTAWQKSIVFGTEFSF